MAATFLAGAALLMLAAFSVLWFLDFRKELSFKVPVNRYQHPEYNGTDLLSRRWMMYAMDLQKRGNYAPATASRLYAYTASIFSDVLDATNDSRAASAATALIVAELIPSRAMDSYSFFDTVSGGFPWVSGTAADILAQYRERARADKFGLKWSRDMLPRESDAWYPRLLENASNPVSDIDTGIVDGGAMAGLWKPWILDDDLGGVPPPPKQGSLADTVDIGEVKYATDMRLPTQNTTISFWHGASGFVKGDKPDNISPSGVWQNILFVEQRTLPEKEYARAQKLLAQALADSFIYTWKIKYHFYTQRPSMRIDGLKIALADPPFPSYVSGHSTVSKTAAVMLSALFPEKEPLWNDLAHDARYSRLLAGIHFDSDNAAGEHYGAQLGNAIVEKLSLTPGSPGARWLGTYQPPGLAENLVATMALSIEGFFRDISLNTLSSSVHSYLSHIRFQDVSSSANLPVGASGYAAWGDYDRDGSLDLLVSDRLYRNTGEGAFEDVTDVSGLSTRLSGKAFFVDYDNDGCEDIFEIRSGDTRLYRNDCHSSFYLSGTFIAAEQGLDQRGVAFADYDGDGLLDAYVVSNYFPHLELEHFTLVSTGPGPNILWKNMGKGVFVDVSRQAGVDGFPKCVKLTQSRRSPPISFTKASYQPIWFDYDNDADQDLFVATDTWVSPLYRNNGDGTFTDVTEAAGLCLPGTGMGVALADIDRNGFFDLYVTNVGPNYLWMNNGDGTFTESTAQRGVDNPTQGWGAHFTDFDNDGDDDLYVTNGVVVGRAGDVMTFNKKNLDWRGLDELYENDGKGMFSSVGTYSGIAGTYFKQASAAADYDNDGKVDLYVAASGHPEGVYNSLYRNVSKTKNHWLELRLVGTKSNRDAAGAVITVTAGKYEIRRIVLRGSSFSAQESMRPHFGLGTHQQADEVIIRWPNGIVQTLHDVSADQILTVTEPEE